MVVIGPAGDVRRVLVACGPRPQSDVALYGGYARPSYVRGSAGRRLLVIGALLLTLPSRSWAGACASGTLDIYTAAGFSCTIDDKTFSAFAYASTGSGGAAVVPASGVAVVPTVVGGEVGFQFYAASTVGPGESPQ